MNLKTKHMIATELRVGNLVKAKNTNGNPNKWVVIKVKPEHIVTCSDKPKWFKPIPLTEKWLLKLGFEFWCNELGVKCFSKCYGIEFITIAENGYWTICAGLNNNSARWRMGNNYPFINSVHQLQNLYWGLCGEELKIEL